MRRLVTRSAGMVGPLVVALVLPTAPAHADTGLVSCVVSQHGTGDVFCDYVATTTHGRATAAIVDVGYSEVDVDCHLSGSGGWLGRSGSIDYNQIPGEICTVAAYMGRAAGSAEAWAGSIL